MAEDALGGTVTHHHDAWGLLERVVQRKPVDDATAAPASIETTMDHDGLGRRTLLKDPDKGTWTFRHNGFGELVRRESAAGHQVTFRHDALGRVTMRDDQLGGTGKRDGQTVWTYDTAAERPGPAAPGQGADVGLLAHARVRRAWAGSGAWPAAWAARRGTSAPPTTPTAGCSSASTPPARRRTYTDFGVRHVYNARGHLARVEDARVRNGTSKATHLAVELTDAAGRVVQERLGGDGGLTRVLGHDGQTGRLLGIVTDKLGGGRLQELEMAWDVGGNLKSRMDKGRKGTLTEDFEYDGLDRLEEHEAGAGPVETITYDGYGNIRSRTGVGTYTYSKAHPGRLDKVAGSTYAHDANGNVTSGGGRSIEYASYDLPTAIQRGLARSEFTYGPDRERLVRRDLSGGELLRETWHLSGVERTRAADGSVELKRFLPGGAMETVAYDADGAETGRRLDYLLSDHLGSVVAVVEGTETASGQTRWDVREERAFDPWGGCRDPDTWKACAKDSVLPKDDGATRRGFTGHETLGAVGLVHMNGRIYDPALGRFLQADPYVQSGSDLQGLNRYAYVLNNPLNAVDPTGHFVFSLAAAAYMAHAGVTAWTIFLVSAAAFADAMLAGADFGQALHSGLIAGITAGAFSGLSGALPAAKSFGHQLLRGAVFGVVGGMTSLVGGGRFGHGFVSAGLGAGFGGPLGDWLVGEGIGDAAAATITAALIGGTSSALTGGKFANAAAWAALSNAAVQAASRIGPLVGDLLASTCSTSEECGGPPTGEEIPAFVAAFDGAGGPNAGGNADFRAHVEHLGEVSKAQIVSYNSGPKSSPVNAAVDDAMDFLSSNPDGEIFAIGYSAGGRDAISFVRRLLDEGVAVREILTFDPVNGKNPWSLASGGASKIKIPDEIRAYNYYQRGPRDTAKNFFRGARLVGARASNVNLTGRTTHSGIVGYYRRCYSTEFEGARPSSC